MSDNDPHPLRSALVTTLKAAVVIAAMSVLAADLLSRGGLDRSKMGLLAARATGGFSEPATTGTINAASATKLDPCGLRPDRRR
jgi:hypothetical protein